MIKLIVIVYLSTETALKVARYVEISCGVKRSTLDSTEHGYLPACEPAMPACQSFH